VRLSVHIPWSQDWQENRRNIQNAIDDGAVDLHGEQGVVYKVGEGAFRPGPKPQGIDYRQVHFRVEFSE